MMQRNNFFVKAPRDLFLPRFTGEVVRRIGREDGKRDDQAVCFSTHYDNDLAPPSASHNVLGTSPATQGRKFRKDGPAAQGRKASGTPP